jgi:predicted nuclease with TOPRIM domain
VKGLNADNISRQDMKNMIDHILNENKQLIDETQKLANQYKQLMSEFEKLRNEYEEFRSK